MYINIKYQLFPQCSLTFHNFLRIYEKRLNLELVKNINSPACVEILDLKIFVHGILKNGNIDESLF